MTSPYREGSDGRYTARELLAKLRNVYEEVDLRAILRDRPLTWREVLGIWMTERLIGERWHLLALLWVIKCLEEYEDEPWFK